MSAVHAPDWAGLSKNHAESERCAQTSSKFEPSCESFACFDPPRPRVQPGVVARLDAFERGVKTEAGGGRHTELGPACHLLPPLALLHTAEVLRRGAEKYGVDNWRGIPVAENVNHAITHLVRWCATGDMADLAHASCRVLFALEQEAGR